MEKVVEMVLVFIIIEATAIFSDCAAFTVALRLENIPRLEKDSASVLVDLLEPVP